MHGKLDTRSELIGIPGPQWAIRGHGVTPAEIAAIALGIERRRIKRVLLPNEANRYAVACIRLSEIALELLEESVATRMWSFDSATTSNWATLSFNLLNRLRLAGQPDPSWEFLPRLQSTFIPPDFTAGVARFLEHLVQVESVGWQDRLIVLPILEARRDAFTKAATDGSGLIEVVRFSCS
jgi:hypothetical protein